MDSTTPVFFQETENERQAIIDAIRVNGQPLKDADWFQLDRVVNIWVPDGFRGVVYPDSHSPYENIPVLRAEFRMAEEVFKPHLAFDLGDVANEEWLGRWALNLKNGQAFSNRDEMDAAARQLRRKSKAGRPKKLFLIPGNHDDRERARLSDEGAKFASLRNGSNREFLTDFATNLLGLTEADSVTFCWGIGQTGGREGGVMLNDLSLRHGNFVDPKPGYSSYKHWLKQIRNILIGHIHRMGWWMFEDRTGRTHQGGDGGVNMNTQSPGANYMGPDNDWLQGFTFLECRNGVIHMQPIPFLLGEDENGRQREYATWVDTHYQVHEFAVVED